MAHPVSQAMYSNSLLHLNPHHASAVMNNMAEDSYDSCSQLSKPKRVRTVFTTTQVLHLESEFQKNMFLHRTRRIKIARRLSLCEKKVKVWFQNRRMKRKNELRRPQGTTTNTKTTPPVMEQNGHKGIVQRLMAYSQAPLLHAAKKMCYNPTFPDAIEIKSSESNVCKVPTKDINIRKQISPPIAVQNQSPPFSYDLCEILEDINEYLSSNSSL